MLAVLLLGQFMGLVDVFVVNVALPAIGADLRASGASLQLVVGGYTVAYAMLLITGARLGDLYGRRRLYLIGAVGFTLASLACGLAPTSLALILFRFGQGAAAAAMVPQIMSVIQTWFTGAARAAALSAYGVVLSTGAAAGLIIGGVVVQADLFGQGWRPVFLVNVPFGLALAVLVPRVLPSDPPAGPGDGRRQLDLPGLVLSAAAVSLVVLPLVVGRELGWPAWTFVALAAGLGTGVVFVRVERATAARGGDPLLRLEVLRAPGFGVALSALACLQIGYGGFLFVFTLSLHSLGRDPLATGLTYLPLAVVFGLVGYFWRRMPQRVHRFLPAVGLAGCAVAYTAIAWAPTGGPGLWAGLVVDGAGLGLAVSPLLTLALVGVPVTRAGDASGLLTTTMQLSQVLGVAVVGTVFLALAAPALASTAFGLAVLALIGLVPAVRLARS